MTDVRKLDRTQMADSWERMAKHEDEHNPQRAAGLSADEGLVARYCLYRRLVP